MKESEPKLDFLTESEKRWRLNNFESKACRGAFCEGGNYAVIWLINQLEKESNYRIWETKDIIKFINTKAT